MTGRLETHRFTSHALEGNPLGDPAERTLHVWVPPGASGRLPVVYFLHGFAGTVDGWLQSPGFGPNMPVRLGAKVGAGELPPFLAVFVDGWTALGGAQWLNSPATGNYLDYLSEDVVRFVDAAYATVDAAGGRALVGKSSGAYGALVAASLRPGRFGHLACHAPDSAFEYCYLHDLPKVAGALLAAGGPEAWLQGFRQRVRETKMRGDDFAVINILAMAAAYSPRAGAPLGLDLPFEPHTARLRLEVWKRWTQHDPVRFVPERVESFQQLSSLFLDCGTRDEFNLRWGARMVSESLRAAGVDHVHEEFEDGHMGINYRFERSLSYLLPRMAR
ncbi:MAG: alpha/beta hydrolase [Deltaproteobacteria bacterium]|nr:alpha/beta hydrolase [Deltaproteobacteria bacterium]